MKLHVDARMEREDGEDNLSGARRGRTRCSSPLEKEREEVARSACLCVYIEASLLCGEPCSV